MNESKKELVDRLLAADPPSTAGRGRYEKQVRAMFEKKLSRRERWVYGVSGVLMGSYAALLIVCAAMWLVDALHNLNDGLHALKLDNGFPTVTYFMAVCALMGVALFVVNMGIFIRAAWKGTINRRTTGRIATGVGVVFVGLLGLLALVAAPQFPEEFRDDLRAFGLVLVIYGAVAWLRNSITQSEMKTAEKLLEIELRLAEIGEARERPATINAR